MSAHCRLYICLQFLLPHFLHIFLLSYLLTCIVTELVIGLVTGMLSLHYLLLILHFFLISDNDKILDFFIFLQQLFFGNPRDSHTANDPKHFSQDSSYLQKSHQFRKQFSYNIVITYYVHMYSVTL